MCITKHTHTHTHTHKHTRSALYACFSACVIRGFEAQAQLKRDHTFPSESQVSSYTPIQLKHTATHLLNSMQCLTHPTTPTHTHTKTHTKTDTCAYIHTHTHTHAGGRDTHTHTHTHTDTHTDTQTRWP